MKLNRSKKKILYFSLGIFILVSGIFAVNALIAGTRHAPTNILVTIDDTYTMTLQEAILGNYLKQGAVSPLDSITTSLSVGHDPEEIWVYVNQDEMTLETAINTVGLCGNSNPKGSYTNYNLNPGHRASEIEYDATRNLQQVIDAGDFCDPLATCEGVGGTMGDCGGTPCCKFSMSSCPGGWDQLENWNKVVSNFCDECGRLCSNCQPTSFSNQAVTGTGYSLTGALHWCRPDLAEMCSWIITIDPNQFIVLQSTNPVNYCADAGAFPIPCNTYITEIGCTRCGNGVRDPEEDCASCPSDYGACGTNQECSSSGICQCKPGFTDCDSDGNCECTFRCWGGKCCQTPLPYSLCTGASDAWLFGGGGGNGFSSDGCAEDLCAAAGYTCCWTNNGMAYWGSGSKPTFVAGSPTSVTVTT